MMTHGEGGIRDRDLSPSSLGIPLPTVRDENKIRNRQKSSYALLPEADTRDEITIRRSNPAALQTNQTTYPGDGGEGRGALSHTRPMQTRKSKR